MHEEVAYLPWSPLAGGALTGKYLAGARPAGTRWSMLQRNGLFRDTAESNQAIAVFTELAHSHGVSPVTAALGWVAQVEGVTSTIIGATSMEQLQQNIAAFSVPLSSAMLDDIAAFLRKFPAPF